MARHVRCDYATGVITLDASPSAISPTVSPAVRTPEGYLIVDAYIARDGLLEYRDGVSSWMEYRPRAELEKAALTWAGKPVTDDHPEELVTAETWAEVAKGVHVSAPSIEVVDDVGYLRARLQITDAELIGKIDAGLRELSIGFTTAVLPCEEGIAPDGTECDAIQTDLVGNHTAVVKAGRAGPAVRLLMDGKEVPVNIESDIEMKANNKKKADAVATPVEQVEVVGPDGMPVMLPTWVAEALMELQALQAAAQAQEPATEPAEEQPAMEAAAEQPSEAAAAPPEASPPEEETEEKKDNLRELARKRARLERLAAQAGVAEAVLDSDDDTLARAYISKQLPSAKLDGLSSEQLEAVVAVAATVDRQDKAPETYVWQTIPAPRKDTKDPVREAELNFLRSQGYA